MNDDNLEALENALYALGGISPPFVDWQKAVATYNELSLQLAQIGNILVAESDKWVAGGGEEE